MKADDEESLRGGTLILVWDKTVTLKTIPYKDAGFIKITVEWGTETLEFANVYAHRRVPYNESTTTTHSATNSPPTPS